MKIKSKIPRKILKDIEKLGIRKQQDIERGLDEPGFIFPPVVHEIGEDDLKGNPKKLGKIGLGLSRPNISSVEFSVAQYFLKSFQKWLIGKKPPQKRVRQNHDRDKSLIYDIPKIKTSHNGERTKRTFIDEIIDRETIDLKLEELGEQEKKIKKKLIQAKYRYKKSSKST